jgi:hypothetical protein
MKQHIAGKHVDPPGLTILIPSQPICALSPDCSVASGEAINTNFVVFGLTRPGLAFEIYRTRGEHANKYTTDAVLNPQNHVMGQLGIMILSLISTNLYFLC